MRLMAIALFAVFLLVTGAEAAPPASAPDSEHLVTPDRVIASLNQTLAWYREARVAMRAVGTVFAREDEQTALARRLGYEEYPRQAFIDDYLRITRRCRRAMERVFQEELA